MLTDVLTGSEMADLRSSMFALAGFDSSTMLETEMPLPDDLGRTKPSFPSDTCRSSWDLCAYRDLATTTCRTYEPLGHR